MIEEVRKKWNEYPELEKCHHFLFDYHVRPLVKNRNILFMGINPGEEKTDRTEFPEGKHEESQYIYFRDHIPKNGRKWYEIIDKMIPKQFGVVQSELFFWSSPNINYLNKHIPDWKKGSLIDFCTKANKWLIKEYKFPLVIVTSVTYMNLVAKKYNLSFVDKIISKNTNRRLIERYSSENGETWLFCLHPTGTHGLTNELKSEIFSNIKIECNLLLN
tara:strand:- start:1697 stop:2347 length:651 start_codon:yes stop_codon:yes gene_type:complete